MNLCFPGVPALSVVIYVVKNASRPKPVTFSPAQDGKHFTFQVGWIVTLTEGVNQVFSAQSAAQSLRGNKQRNSLSIG